MTVLSAPGSSTRRGLHRIVVHDLGLRIVRGELGAGATLPTEADRSAQTDVLAWQVQAGPDPAFFADLVEVRDFIEPRAVEIAADRATAEERVARLGLQEEMETAGASSAASARLDVALHAAILRATHNGLLAELTGAIIAALGAGTAGAFRVPGGPEGSNQAHRLVVEAIGRADAVGARRSMEALIASTGRGAEDVVEGRSAAGRNT